MSRKSNTEIMAQDHWAIIESVSTHHEADERSKTHPGHGYPAHTTTALVYRPYETKDDALDAVRSQPSHKTYTVIRALKATIETTLAFKFETGGSK